MDQSDQVIAAARDILSGCFNEIRFARATDLAHARRYKEAKALLTSAGRLPADPKELDLLARIAALQRQFLEAEHLWQNAGKISPGNDVYRLAAAQAAKARHTHAQFKQLAFALCVAFALSAVILALINALTSATHKPIRPPVNPPKHLSSAGGTP